MRRQPVPSTEARGSLICDTGGRGRAREGRRSAGGARSRREGGRCSRPWPSRRTNAEIAGLRCVSERTVESHVSSLLHKLGAANRMERPNGPGPRPSSSRTTSTPSPSGEWAPMYAGHTGACAVSCWAEVAAILKDTAAWGELGELLAPALRSTRRTRRGSMGHGRSVARPAPTCGWRTSRSRRDRRRRRRDEPATPHADLPR